MNPRGPERLFNLALTIVVGIASIGFIAELATSASAGAARWKESGCNTASKR